MDSYSWLIADEDREAPNFKVFYLVLEWLQQDSIRKHRRFLEEHPALLKSSTVLILKIILSIVAENLEEFQRLTQADEKRVKELFTKYKQIFRIVMLSANTDLIEYIRELCPELIKALEIILAADQSVQTIRTAFIDVFGGIHALDIPSWLEQEVQSIIAMRHQDQLSAKEEVDRWQKLIARSKEDKAVPEEAIAELWLFQAYMLLHNDTESDSHSFIITALRAALEILTPDRYPLRHAEFQDILAELSASYEQNNKLSASSIIDNEASRRPQLETTLSTDNATEKGAQLGEKLIILGLAYLAKTDEQLDEDDCERAIQSFKLALTLYSQEESPEQWATCQLYLGISYSLLNEKASNKYLDLALASFQCALQVFTRDAFPREWAISHLRYAATLYERVTQEKKNHATEIIEHVTLALEVLTREAFPEEWAGAQILLGQIAARSPGAENFAVADNYYKAALEVFQSDIYARERAKCYAFLGELYGNVDEKRNSTQHELAIQYFEMALPAYDARSRQWAMIQLYLGRAYYKRLQGDPGENNRKAIDCYIQALEVFNRETSPLEWGQAQYSLAMAYKDLEGDETNNIEKAIAATEATLQVYTRHEYPEEWAKTQQALGMLHLQRRSETRSSNIEKARHHFLAALHVFTQAEYSQEWAVLQHDLAMIYWQRFEGEPVDNIERGIYYCESALHVYTYEQSPVEWARTQVILANLFHERVQGNKRENQEQALQICLTALAVFSYTTYPTEWASIQWMLAEIYKKRQTGTSSENLALAVEYYKAALQVYQLGNEPEKYRIIQLDLARLYGRQGNWQAVHDAYMRAREAEDLLIRLGTGLVGQHQVIGHLSSARDAGARAGFALVRLGKKEEAVLAIESGQARIMAATLAMDAFNPLTIKDADLRERYIQKSQSYAKAQKRLHRLLTTDVPDDERRLLHITGSELVRIEQTALENVIEEIRRASEANFQAETPDIKTIMQIANQTSRKHALVYLMATPWGGMAVAVFGADPEDQKPARIAAFDLPQLHDRVIADLLHSGLADETRPVIGGFVYAQHHSGFSFLLRDWKGISFEGYAEHLHDACMLEGKTGTLDQTAQDILQAPDFTHIISQPLKSLSTENLLHLIHTFDTHFLQAELKRVLDTLVQAGIPQMADWLLAQSATSVTIIPCGWLATLPLAAVLCRDGKTMGELLSISVAPNARSLQQRNETNTKNRSNVYALGNPYPTFQPLPWGEAEAYTIAKLARSLHKWGGVKVEDNAKRQWLINALEKGFVVDASCHGEFDRHNFLRSALYLAHGEKLTLGDMLSRQVDLRGLRLLMLSACRTASADVEGAAANEVKSLAVGMLQAGAQAILATLWPVDDYATFILMVRFAQIWLPDMESVPPAQALAQAQQWMRTITNRELQHWQTSQLPALTSEETSSLTKAASALSTGARGNGTVAEIIMAGMRSNRYGYDIKEAQNQVAAIARKGDPDALPFANPIYWAGFQITGW
jgi:CHAT domain-containing protein